ncbi:MAG: mechanosensitive ion channel protein [Candidatus Sericytochromatia bacterium]|nr:MAG: mechanosensitive ion channel protein [Candidatus Sericytochromatia bacterium]
MFEDLIKNIPYYLTIYGSRILGSILILILGRYAAKIITNIIDKLAQKQEIDKTLIKFSGKIIYVILLILVVITSLGNLGIETTSFIAVLGSAGLAIGLALQGSLSNFASGFLIIIFKHFKVGDFVDVSNGVTGTVNEIGILNTILTTPDNKVIIIPNSSITSNKVINYSKQEIRRVDLTFSVSYSDDIKKVKKILSEIVNSKDKILKDKEIIIVVGELADSSVNFFVRFWVSTPDYWEVYWDTIESVKIRFDEEGITIPFPQRDIHLYNN